ncbi:MAG: penicillin-binding protein 1C, partial [Fusobacterium sp.]|nr:penicillin-binding protein 1C [Fusobacterium sp.]
KKIFVDEDNNILDSRDKNFIKTQEKIIIEYPIEVSNFYYNYLDTEININKNVKIAYPTNKLNISLPKDFSGYQKLAIKLYNPAKQYVYWYIDDKYYGFSNEEERLFDLSDGEHKLLIVSEDGKRDEVKFNINRR